MSDFQNPSLPDLMLPEYTPDPELLAREKAIYDRIMKSPSDRAKERTAEMWNERYGVKPESGKLRRILAGIGEVARGIGAGAKYQSIPDMAREEAMKEYQAEVPNLNRELATISGQKNAAMSAMQKQNAASLKYAVDSYRAAMAGVKSQAEADAINAKTPAQIKLLAAQTEETEARGALASTRADVLDKTKGLGGVFGAAALAGSLPDADRNKFLRNFDAFSRLAGLNRGGAGGSKTWQNITTTGKRTQWVDGPNGPEKVEVESQSTRPQLVSTPVNPAEADRIRAETFGTAPSTEAGPSQQAQPPSAIPGVIPPAPSSPPRPTAMLGADPKSGKPFRRLNPQTGKFEPTNIHPTQEGVLSIYKKNKPLPNWLAARFQNEVNPTRKKFTADEQTQLLLTDATSELMRSVTDSYAKGELKDITGLGPNIMNKIKAMQSGGLSFGEVRTIADAVDAMSTKIFSLSGKAVTENEFRRFSRALPDIGMDSDTTLLFKSMLMSQNIRRQQYQKALKLSPPEMSAVMRVAGGDLEKNTIQQLAVLSSLNKAAKLNLKDPKAVINVTFPNSKTPVKMTRKEALDLVNLMNERDYEIFTDALSKVGQ